jgi:hypothetical protein
VGRGLIHIYLLLWGSDDPDTLDAGVEVLVDFADDFLKRMAWTDHFDRQLGDNRPGLRTRHTPLPRPAVVGHVGHLRTPLRSPSAEVEQHFADRPAAVVGTGKGVQASIEK